MTPRDTYLPVLDFYRGTLDTVWGLRQYSVLVRVNTWTPGLLLGSHGATKTAVDTPLLVNGARVKVEQISQKDVINSGGIYSDQDIRVGPLTPPFVDSQGNPGGINPTVFEPVVTGSNVEVLFKVTGPAYPQGAWFKKVEDVLIKGNFRYEIVLRKTGVQNA